MDGEQGVPPDRGGRECWPWREGGGEGEHGEGSECLVEPGRPVLGVSAYLGAALRDEGEQWPVRARLVSPGGGHEGVGGVGVIAVGRVLVGVASVDGCDAAVVPV